MKRVIMIGLIASLCSGCASTKTGEGGLMQRYSESRQLAQAEKMLASGDTAGATKALSALSNAPPVPGVTDEALFRLALLTLNPDPDRPASARGHKLLKRLQKEYPKSPWTRLAAPLNELIDVAEDAKHQNRTLKGTNQALTKEIGELMKSIEQLKHLDLELEMKSR